MNADVQDRVRPRRLLNVLIIGSLLSLLQVAWVSADAHNNLIPLSDLETLSVTPGPQERYRKIVLALDRDGYTIETVRQTVLNRALIRARNQYHLREIVVSRASGQVLRDVIIEEFETNREGDTAVPLDQILESDEGRLKVLPR
ncbi:MAG: hypothetical protein ACK4TM_13640 [Yoonia sp.]